MKTKNWTHIFYKIIVIASLTPVFRTKEGLVLVECALFHCCLVFVLLILKVVGFLVLFVKSSDFAFHINFISVWWWNWLLVVIGHTIILQKKETLDNKLRWMVKLPLEEQVRKNFTGSWRLQNASNLKKDTFFILKLIDIKDLKAISSLKHRLLMSKYLHTNHFSVFM